VYTINLKEGKIDGKEAEYTFLVPQLWRTYLTADIELGGYESIYLDKLNFYYMPQNSLAKPEFLMSLYISSPEVQEEEYMHKIMETNKYSFFVNRAEANNMTSELDLAFFQIFINNVSDDEFLKDLIRFPEDQYFVTYNTVFVGDIELASSAVKERNKLYLPLRELADALDYEVSWNPELYMVTLENEENIINLFVQNNFNVITRDDRTYVSTIFVIQGLDKNVEIDNKSNIYIT
jgi:hypothetical protein